MVGIRSTCTGFNRGEHLTGSMFSSSSSVTSSALNFGIFLFVFTPSEDFCVCPLYWFLRTTLRIRQCIVFSLPFTGKNTWDIITCYVIMGSWGLVDFIRVGRIVRGGIGFGCIASNVGCRPFEHC